MINLLFYISIIVVSLILSLLFVSFDNWLDKKLLALRIEREGLESGNWLLKYELWRSEITGKGGEE